VNLIESILKRPFKSAAIYSAVVLVLLCAFSLFELFKVTGSANSFSSQNAWTLFLNIFLATGGVLFALFPSVAARLLSVKMIWEKIGKREVLSWSLIVTEAISFIFIMNVLMGSIASGANGILAQFLVIFVLVLVTLFWVFLAIGLHFYTRDKPFLPSHNVTS
jgi:hypothetical protein